MKKLWGIYNIIQFTFFLHFTVDHIAVCGNDLQHMHFVLHRNRKDKLVRKQFMLLSKFTFTSFKKLIGVCI